jgi:hypothetical protein
VHDTYVDGILVALLHAEQLDLASMKQVPPVNRRDMVFFKASDLSIFLFQRIALPDRQSDNRAVVSLI